MSNHVMGLDNFRVLAAWANRNIPWERSKEIVGAVYPGADIILRGVDRGAYEDFLANVLYRANVDSVRRKYPRGPLPGPSDLPEHIRVEDGPEHARGLVEFPPTLDDVWIHRIALAVEIESYGVPQWRDTLAGRLLREIRDVAQDRLAWKGKRWFEEAAKTVRVDDSVVEGRSLAVACGALARWAAHRSGTGFRVDPGVADKHAGADMRGYTLSAPDRYATFLADALFEEISVEKGERRPVHTLSLYAQAGTGMGNMVRVPADAILRTPAGQRGAGEALAAVRWIRDRYAPEAGDDRPFADAFLSEVSAAAMREMPGFEDYPADYDLYLFQREQEAGAAQEEGPTP